MGFCFDFSRSCSPQLSNGRHGASGAYLPVPQYFRTRVTLFAPASLTSGFDIGRLAPRRRYAAVG